MSNSGAKFHVGARGQMAPASLGGLALRCAAFGLSVLAGASFLAASTDTARAAEVHFHSISELTGQSAFFGIGSTREMKLLADKVNAAGGLTDSCGNVYTVKLTLADAANSREQAVAAFQKAADDESVLGILGSPNDVSWLPLVPVAGQRKVPMIIPSDGSRVTNWNPYAFRVLGDASTWFSGSLAKFIRAEPELKKVALLFDQTQDGMAFDKSLWNDNAAGLGLEIVAEEAGRAGDTDFRAQLTKIRGSGAEVLNIGFGPPELAKILNQMPDVGLNLPVISAFGINTASEVWDLTQGKSKGTYFFAPGAVSDKMANPEAKTLYEEAYGETPLIWHVIGWDALAVALDAVKRSCTNTDREKFRDALGSTNGFPMVAGGSITWSNPPNGENVNATGVAGIVSGPNTFDVLE